jgi:hypothetical protein
MPNPFPPWQEEHFTPSEKREGPVPRRRRRRTAGLLLKRENQQLVMGTAYRAAGLLYVK